MAKFHFNPKTNKIAPCKATKRVCRYETFNSLEEAQKVADGKIKQSTATKEKGESPLDYKKVL